MQNILENEFLTRDLWNPWCAKENLRMLWFRFCVWLHNSSCSDPKLCSSLNRNSCSGGTHETRAEPGLSQNSMCFSRPRVKSASRSACSASPLGFEMFPCCWGHKSCHWGWMSASLCSSRPSHHATGGNAVSGQHADRTAPFSKTYN